MTQTICGVLVIAAHPNDEVSGCDRTIVRHYQLGDSVSVLMLTNGVGARNSGRRWGVGQRSARRCACTEKISNLLNVCYREVACYQDNHIDSILT